MCFSKTVYDKLQNYEFNRVAVVNNFNPEKSRFYLKKITLKRQKY